MQRQDELSFQNIPEFNNLATENVANNMLNSVQTPGLSDDLGKLDITTSPSLAFNTSPASTPTIFPMISSTEHYNYLGYHVISLPVTVRFVPLCCDHKPGAEVLECKLKAILNSYDLGRHRPEWSGKTATLWYILFNDIKPEFGNARTPDNEWPSPVETWGNIRWFARCTGASKVAIQILNKARVLSNMSDSQQPEWIPYNPEKIRFIKDHLGEYEKSVSPQLNVNGSILIQPRPDIPEIFLERAGGLDNPNPNTNNNADMIINPQYYENNDIFFGVDVQRLSLLTNTDQSLQQPYKRQHIASLEDINTSRNTKPIYPIPQTPSTPTLASGYIGDQSAEILRLRLEMENQRQQLALVSQILQTKAVSNNKVPRPRGRRGTSSPTTPDSLSDSGGNNTNTLIAALANISGQKRPSPTSSPSQENTFSFPNQDPFQYRPVSSVYNDCPVEDANLISEMYLKEIANENGVNVETLRPIWNSKNLIEDSVRRYKEHNHQLPEWMRDRARYFGIDI